MPNLCGKVAERLRTGLRKSRVLSSTFVSLYIMQLGGARAKVRVIRALSLKLFHDISPLKFVPLPLAEHYFYPVSTVPINNYSRKKIKER